MCVKDVPDLHRYVVADSLNDCYYTWKILFGTTNLKRVSEKEMLNIIIFEKKYLKMKSLTSGVIWSLILMITTMGIYMWFLSGVKDHNGQPLTMNEIGDAFGLFNAIFSCLGFGVIYLSLELQYNTIQAQRKEIDETKKELLQQRETMNLDAKLNGLSAICNHYTYVYIELKKADREDFREAQAYAEKSVLEIAKILEKLDIKLEYEKGKTE